MKAIVHQGIGILLRIGIRINDIAALEGVRHGCRIAHELPADAVDGDLVSIVIIGPLCQCHRLLVRPVCQLIRTIVDSLVRVGCVGIAVCLHNVFTDRVCRRECQQAVEICTWISQRHDKRLVILCRCVCDQVQKRAVVAG